MKSIRKFIADQLLKLAKLIAPPTAPGSEIQGGPPPTDPV